ncbi:hypothetical protein GCM10020229_17230 [Kitasatospora albolonga]
MKVLVCGLASDGIASGTGVGDGEGDGDGEAETGAEGDDPSSAPDDEHPSNNATAARTDPDLSSVRRDRAGSLTVGSPCSTKTHRTSDSRP